MSKEIGMEGLLSPVAYRRLSHRLHQVFMSPFWLRNRYVLALDILLILQLPTLALALRLDLSVPRTYYLVLSVYTALALLVKIAVFYRFGLYNRFWRYASVGELVTITAAVLCAGVVVTALFHGLRAIGILDLDQASFPRSLPVLDTALTLLAVGGLRFSVRAAEHFRHRRQPGAARRVLIIGAGSSGSLLVRELRANPRAGLEPVGFIDDDPAKRHLRIFGLPVIGPHTRLAEIARKTQAQEALIAIPSASGKTIRQIIDACQRAGLPSRTLPGLTEIISGQVSVNHLRPVKIEDLLRRAPVKTDLTAVRAMLAGRRVLITGAGGSIGSELCRQIASCGPAEIIALGHGENSLFQLSQDMARVFKTLPLTRAHTPQLVVADIRDRSRMAAVFQRFQPEVVFHAAAHKHVPLMESNIEDAVTSNVLGTRQVVELAEAHGVERFVLISSDKAVNPTSIMGVTKRIGELLVSEAAERCGRPFVSVRFGNVLGSRGSVLPAFHQQILQGGPLTLTHPDMQRYFMTIPEAVQLVLQSAVLGEPGCVYVLNMGQPVKLVDLAADLVRLSGLQVGRDIDFVFTGLRPGEKLVEELFGGAERFKLTTHSDIFVSQNGHRAHPEVPLGEMVEELVAAARASDPAALRYWLQQLVPEYQPEVDFSTPPLTVLPADEHSTRVA
jgi:FlaA1/EpsC-like NDP-sugar epimerase